PFPASACACCSSTAPLLSLISPCFPPLLYLPSFPTRRSSDLVLPRLPVPRSDGQVPAGLCRSPRPDRALPAPHRGAGPEVRGQRSEEHTSELQSRFDLVCRLLLEKKNQDRQTA